LEQRDAKSYLSKRYRRVIKAKNGRAAAFYTAFSQQLPKARTMLVGQEGISVEDFLSHPASHWMKGL